ncbi:MAG: hypothetical protein LBQ55_02780, partial [Treponema sp.]|nr:hypothetical protein [Treponema sp.]
GIPGFTVAAEARWIRASPWACAVGFLFNPAPRQVQKYLDFLSAPDSQNSAAGSGPSGGV